METKNKLSRNKLKKQETVAGILLILPAVLYLFIWIIGPAIFAFVMSFTNYDLLRPQLTEVVFLDNYKKIISDPKFHQAMRNTFKYAIIVVPCQTAIALGLAMICNAPLRAKTALRVVYYLPGVTSGVAVASIFMFLFSKNGIINEFLSIVGFQSVNWASSEKYALPLIMIMAIWGSTGFNMLIYLAGLQEIPKSVYEAAEVDGANRWQVFKNIIFPLLKDKTFFVLVVGFIGCLQTFDQAYIVSGGQGGPNGSTLTAVLYLYIEAFTKNQMGYASAVAFVLFAIIFTFTMIQKKLFKEES